ncbi:MFS transporter [Phytomonospora sp. NPDC050363]|uniref:MFS transporter n=1 Tax=Phytomonospora sp. NPDC050363 TaxID=3155642 RepID=UPI0033C61329
MPSPLITRAKALLPDPGPARALTYASLIGSVGRGLFITVSVIYFHKSVGLSEVEVGLGMTLAACLGLFAGVPIGGWADRRGPRGIAVGFGVAAAVVDLGYLLVGDFIGFVVVAALVSVLGTGSHAARGALIAGSVPPEQQVRTRAYLRSVTNVGWTLGAPLAGIALQVDRREVYVALILVTVALYFTAALMYLRVPALKPTPAAKKESRTLALRDKPYVALTALNAVMTVHFQVFNVVIPLWVVSRTSAPAWMVSVLAVLNTTFIILLQVRVSRGSATIRGAARAQRNAGFLLFGACALYALAADRSVGLAIAALCLGGLLHVFGELLHAAGGWGLSFDLAPAHAQGQFQGLYNTGFQIAEIIAPAALVALVIGQGMRGWLILGAAFVAAGLAVPLAARWAERTRPAPLALDEVVTAA